jgi:hypothetical protein
MSIFADENFEDANAMSNRVIAIDKNGKLCDLDKCQNFINQKSMNQLEILKVSVGKIPLMLAFSKSRFREEEVMMFNQQLNRMISSGAWAQIMQTNGMGDLMEAPPSIKP